VTRREFSTLLSGVAVWPVTARAESARVARIGIIDNAPIWDHFRQGLRDHGYVEGRNVIFEYRVAEGQPERLAAAAGELARLPVDVIATFGSPASRAAQQATSTIPVVAMSVGDPVRIGLVQSLARPGGNITGNTILGPENRCQAAATPQGVHPLGFPSRLPLEPRQRIQRRPGRGNQGGGSGLEPDADFSAGAQPRRVRPGILRDDARTP
jgi:ABC transporter substrate binding protein